MKKGKTLLLIILALTGLMLVSCGEAETYNIDVSSAETTDYARLTQEEWIDLDYSAIFLTNVEQNDRLLLRCILVRDFLTSEEFEAARIGIKINGEEFVFTDGSQQFPYETQIIGYLRNVRTGNTNIGIVPYHFYGGVYRYNLFSTHDYSSSAWIMSDMRREVEIDKNATIFLSYGGPWSVEYAAVDIFVNSNFTPQDAMDGMLIDGVFNPFFDNGEIVLGSFIQHGIRINSSR